jgi:PAS domain S-box-containing protein
MPTPVRHVPHQPPSSESPPAPPQRRLERPPIWRIWLDRTASSFAPLVGAFREGYGFAIVVVGSATAAAFMLRLGAEPGIFAPFLVAVTAVALRHGIGPALFAVVSAAVVAYVWFFAPLATLAFDPVGLRHLTFFRLGVFVGAGLVITLLAEMHRQSLQQLERSRRQLRAFTSNEDIGLQVIDHEGKIAWSDNGTARLLGYAPSEWVGRPFATIHADAALAGDIQASLATGQAVENVRATLLRKDGTTQDVLINSNALLGDARMDGTGVLVAVLPLKAIAAVDSTKLAVSFLLERRRKAAAERQASGEKS